MATVEVPFLGREGRAKGDAADQLSVRSECVVDGAVRVDNDLARVAEDDSAWALDVCGRAGESSGAVGDYLTPRRTAQGGHVAYLFWGTRVRRGSR